MESPIFKEPELILSHKCGDVQIDIHHYQTMKPTVRDWWRIAITTFEKDHTYFIFDKLKDARNFLCDLQDAFVDMDVWEALPDG